jgi:hypothetical protein
MPSAKLAADYLDEAQSAAHTKVNKFIALADAVAQLSMKDRDLTAPPGSPVDGDTYLVAASPTGAWSGKAGKIAVYFSATPEWLFVTPVEGWIGWLQDENKFIYYDGAAWQNLNPAGITGSGTLVTVSPMNYPAQLSLSAETSIFGTFSSTVLDASTEKAALIIQAPKSGTIESVEFIPTTGTTVNAASALRVSLQDVSATNGNPDGTQDQYRDLAGSDLSAGTWVSSGIISSNGTDGGTKRSVTKGDILSVVWEYQTFTASDVVRLGGVLRGSFSKSDYPYGDSQASGTWTKQDNLPIVAIKYADGSYVEVAGIWPATGDPTVAYNSGSTPDERALRFKLPAAMRVAGAWFMCDCDGDLEVVLYDNAGTAQRTIAIDKDIRQETTPGYRYVLFSSSIELAANTVYRLAIKPTSATSITLTEVTFNSNAIMAACPGGIEMYLSTRTDGGAWTDDTARRPFIGLIIDGVYDAPA